MMDSPFSHYIIFCLSLSSNNSYNLLNASYVPDTILSKYYLLFMYNGIVLKLLNRFYFFINFFFNFFHINPCLFYFIFYFFPIIFISWRLITLQYCSGFCHTLTGISHGFTCVPHPGPPPPTFLPIPSLWVIPVYQPQALVSCIQPGLAICFTLDNIHASVLFSQIIPPSPSPTESKSLFYTSVSIFLSCI